MNKKEAKDERENPKFIRINKPEGEKGRIWGKREKLRKISKKS